MLLGLDVCLCENDIPIEDICIVAGFALGILGIRYAVNLDFVMLSKYHGKDSDRAVKVAARKKVERVRQNWLRMADGRAIFGDDNCAVNNLSGLPAMMLGGLRGCPKDAVSEIKEACHWGANKPCGLYSVALQ